MDAVFYARFKRKALYSYFQVSLVSLERHSRVCDIYMKKRDNYVS